MPLDARAAIETGIYNIAVDEQAVTQIRLELPTWLPFPSRQTGRHSQMSPDAARGDLAWIMADVRLITRGS